MIAMHNLSEPVTVERYNPEWKTWFEQLCSFFEDKLGSNFIRIEHVGSTSIPGIIAKPIIDLDIVIRISDFDEIKSNLEAIGYSHQGDLGIPEREAFALHNLELQSRLPPHHLYVCDLHSVELYRHMAFRDYLQEHPRDAKTYSELKLRLVEQHKGDRELYIQGKDQQVREILERALTWATERWR